ncbi:UNVERIFIED_CONTAM: hypothetical protein Slati_2125400 [Sesamum latifolium]|uniref:Uncharacterized protein n=1 Tax=Sesamum latifolium TaxID=2727402 RepID=A0AAW2WQD1_9LAMI
MNLLSKQQRLLGSPAEPNDRIIVELSGIGAPWTVQSLRDMIPKEILSHVALIDLLDSRLLGRAMMSATRSSNEADEMVRETQRIETLEQKLKTLKQRQVTTESKIEEHRLLKLIEELTLLEELFWKQRGKKHWLQLGDKNTSCFHTAASDRERNNHIGWLRYEDNRVFDDKEGMQRLIEQYFGEIFGSCHPYPEHVE